MTIWGTVGLIGIAVALVLGYAFAIITIIRSDVSDRKSPDQCLKSFWESLPLVAQAIVLTGPLASLVLLWHVYAQKPPHWLTATSWLVILFGLATSRLFTGEIPYEKYMGPRVTHWIRKMYDDFRAYTGIS